MNSDPKLATLIKARALIQNEQDWTKGHFFDTKVAFSRWEANDLITSPVLQRHPEYLKNCRFCSLGAVTVAADYNDALIEKVQHILDDQVTKETEFRSIITFNDELETTHEQILGVFDKAISLQSLISLNDKTSTGTDILKYIRVE